MFTYFTDRDGKFQLASLAESGFDPLARTCQFMLKEEAHHMFVGAGGVGRVVQRTAELMQRARHRGRRPFRWDQPGHHPALPQLPLQRLARPLRRRDLDQRGQLLRGRAQGSLPGGGPPGRPPVCTVRPAPSTPSTTDRIVDPPGRRPVRPQRHPPRRLHRRLPERASTAGTAPWRRSAPARAAPFPTSAFTGGSGPSPGASSPRPAIWSPNLNGSRAEGTGCLLPPTATT